MRFILIQGRYAATYIRTAQIGVFVFDGGLPDLDNIQEIWEDESSWK